MHNHNTHGFIRASYRHSGALIKIKYTCLRILFFLENSNKVNNPAYKVGHLVALHVKLILPFNREGLSLP